MSMPPLAIHIPTFNRIFILRRCIDGLLQHIRYDGDVKIFVGDDSNGDSEPGVSSELFSYTQLIWGSVIVLTGPRNGLGANLNMLLDSNKRPLIMQLDDDHILRKPLDLTSHAERLLSDTSAGWVRLMGIGGHNYTARLDGTYWVVAWDSKELYIPSNRPHLKHRRFHDYFGKYPEGVKLWQTEEGFCHQCRDIVTSMRSQVAPHVLVPLNSESETAWDHVGQSWQEKGY